MSSRQANEPLESDPLTLERAYVQLLNQVNDLWEWYYRRRLAVLRQNNRSDDWIDGIHVPSKIAGGMVMCCWFANELWVLDPYPWHIKKDAEQEAWKVFVEEVRHDKVASGRP